MQDNNNCNDKVTILKHDGDKTRKISENDIVSYSDCIQAAKENSYRKSLMFIEYVSIAFTIVSFCLSALLAYEDESISALAFSMDSFMDVLAYMVVLWRFSNKDEIRSRKKDRKALVILSIFFMLSSIGVEYESINNLVFSIRPLQSVIYIFIGCIEAIIFSLLSIAKFVIAQKLIVNSTVFSDGVNSLIAAFSSLSMAISMGIYVYMPNIWYLDATFGFIMGALVFIYGCKLFVDNTCFIDDY